MGDQASTSREQKNTSFDLRINKPRPQTSSTVLSEEEVEDVTTAVADESYKVCGLTNSPESDAISLSQMPAATGGGVPISFSVFQQRPMTPTPKKNPNIFFTPLRPDVIEKIKNFGHNYKLPPQSPYPVENNRWFYYYERTFVKGGPINLNVVRECLKAAKKDGVLPPDFVGAMGGEKKTLNHIFNKLKNIQKK